ncbi:MAG TPA: hypothetical protein VFU05_20655 [Cyclobacteriaceae bacterium]|nr:hypothetical protein [Cyclobacteriaceae bacterium]
MTKFLWLLCLLPLTGIGQNLETIGKEKPLSVSGGFSLNQIFYGVHGIESRRDPYSYYTSCNINFSLYGWSVPLSFSVSNQTSRISNHSISRYSPDIQVGNGTCRVQCHDLFSLHIKWSLV